MTALVGQLTELRQQFPQLRPRHWVEGRRADGSYGVLWLTPKATEMTPEDWNFPEGRFLSYVLGPMEKGQPPLYIVLNAAPEEIEFVLPTVPGVGRLECASQYGGCAGSERQLAAGYETSGVCAFCPGVFGGVMNGTRFGCGNHCKPE